MSRKEFDVKDLNLAEQGRWRIEWALKEMPVIRSMMSRTRPGTVRNLGGLVTVTSQPNEGSVFSVFLPIIDEPIEVVDRSKPGEALYGTERILFVDDELIQVQMD